MDCLENLIGISQKCTPDTPKSGLFINQLPGISIDVAASGMDNEQQDAIAFINDKIALAEQNIIQDIRTFVQPRMKSRSVIQSDTAGKLQENLQVIASKVAYRGILMELSNDSYLSFYLNSITLTLDGGETLSVQVFDLMSGATLDTFTITTLPQVPTTIYPNVGYSSGKQKMQVAIVVNATEDSIKTVLDNNCSSCSSTIYRVPFGHRSDNRFAKFTQIELPVGGPFTKAGVSAITHTNGLSINYSVSCDVEPFVCNMANSIAYPLRLKAAVNILDEIVVGGMNGRLNSVVSIFGDEAKELRDSFEQQYQDSMGQILDNLSLDDDVCFECNQQVKYGFVSP